MLISFSGNSTDDLFVKAVCEFRRKFINKRPDRYKSSPKALQNFERVPFDLLKDVKRRHSLFKFANFILNSNPLLIIYPDVS